MRNQNYLNTDHIKSHIEHLKVDLFGIADLRLLERMPTGFHHDLGDLFKYYTRAIVLGTQYGKLGNSISGNKASLFLEKAAMELISLLEGSGYYALIVHPDDEFDPVSRVGLLSLKVLAKYAGLGWQGRSLLIVSPEYGPIHRLIAILTNLPLVPDKPIPNKCAGCSMCVEMCPRNSLTYVPFEDYPKSRREVIDIKTCDGDNGCTVCIEVCPWLYKKIDERIRGTK
jgi:epoxyqueuosine reductase